MDPQVIQLRRPDLPADALKAPYHHTGGVPPQEEHLIFPDSLEKMLFQCQIVKGIVGAAIQPKHMTPPSNGRFVPKYY